MFLTRSHRQDEGAPVGVPSDFVEGFRTSIYKREVTAEQIARHLAADTSPVPATHMREHYHGDRHYDYWLSGVRDYNRVMHYWNSVARRDSFGSFFDMGGSSGRVVRHVAALHPDATVWLSDLGISQIEWALAHLPKNLRAFQSTVLPYLPIPDRSIDIVTAFSVFTHIDQQEYGWLAELSRICAPDGMLYITAMTEETWDACMTIDWRYNGLLRSVKGFDAYERGSPMPADKGRIPFLDANGYGTTFHRRRHIEQVWGRFFDVVDIVVHPEVLKNGEQTLVILRPRT
jgi:SAM-dependent methyltransferase